MQLIFKTGRVSFIGNLIKTGPSSFLIQLIIIIFVSIFLPGLVVPGEGNRAYTDASVLYINEFMADNDNVIEDPDDPNNFEDWIEIYNADVTTINLSGMYLTDDLDNPKQWRIPEGITISAGGYLVFWVDGDEEQGDMHTNFKLDRGGEEIGLFDTDSKRNIAINTVVFGEQSTDISYGRENDGGEAWVFFESSTPGYTNHSINFYMELDTSWNMISLPVRSHNLKLSELFPDAVVVYGFEKETGYIRVADAEDLEVGKGYWILLSNTFGQAELTVEIIGSL
jgi:hypothetical protein